VQNVISYNEREVRRGGSKDDIRQGYNIWRIPPGFTILLAVMVTTSVGLFAFLKGKQWILVSRPDQQEREKEKEKLMQS
jgi:hypothetical protein